MVMSLLPYAERDPDATAVSDEAGSDTWRQLNDRANRLIDVLRGAGMQRGDRIAVHSGNRREAYEVGQACLHAGFYVLQTNWNYLADELAFVLADADARALIVDERYVTQAVDALEGGLPPGSPPPSLRLVLGAQAPPPGFASYEQALAAALPDEPVDQVAGAAMFYTSGTTGRPKGVFPAGLQPGVPVEELQGLGQMVRQGLSIPPDGRTLLVGPVYHSGQWAMTTYPLLCGVPVVLRRLPDPDVILRTIDTERVTNAVLNPVDFVRILKLDTAVRSAFDGSSLVQLVHGGAPCAPDVKRAMIDWLGPRITEYYGASEIGLMAMSTSAEWLAKPGSVGRALPFLDCQILSEEGEPVPAGSEGLIYVRHRSGADFSYHKQPEKTAECHRGLGQFTLGDIGYFDDAGYLFLSDRRSEVINSGGVKLYPAEIEGVLAAHPDVDDVAVFGVPNADLGEEIKAAVKLSSGVEQSDSTARALLEYAAARLAAYKVPASIDFFDELPRTDAGKLAKAPLRATYWEGSGRRI